MGFVNLIFATQLHLQTSKSMTIFRKNITADTIGAIASTICFVHCIVTPLLFVAKACSASCCASAEIPLWWKAIDYIFIVISFIAIYYASKNSTKKWLKFGLWFSWATLLLTLVAESFALSFLPETFIYYPALSIVALHLYNHRFCACTPDKACIA